MQPDRNKSASQTGKRKQKIKKKKKNHDNYKVWCCRCCYIRDNARPWQVGKNKTTFLRHKKYTRPQRAHNVVIILLSLLLCRHGSRYRNIIFRPIRHVIILCEHFRGIRPSSDCALLSWAYVRGGGGSVTYRRFIVIILLVVDIIIIYFVFDLNVYKQNI